MNLLSKFLNRTDFSDYDDFRRNAKLCVPSDFNFGFDVVDEYARLCPEKRALVWCNQKGEEKVITFGEMKELSLKMCNVISSYGVKKGDFVMSMLNRRWEYWVLVVACCKMGVVLIPATHMLTPKDVAYRVNEAGVKLLFATEEEDVAEHISLALPDCKNLKGVLSVNGAHFDNLDEKLENAPAEFSFDARPNPRDLMLVYFTSGTTGMPKMVMHDFLYPLGHVFTAKYWQDVVDDGLHFTMAETGWAKCSWGKIYGQWISGTAVFAYDYHGRFTPTDVLPLVQKYGITTFCAPPTIYRFLVKEDLSSFDLSSIKHCSTAGESLNPEVFKQFEKATGLKIYEGFGQTEGTVMLGTFKYLSPVTGSLGKPSPLYDVRLIDDDENEVKPGEEGEIAILKSENQCGLVAGYFKDEARTSALKNDVYFHTGDLAYQDKDGWFWYVGRKDDIIKSSGYRIGPFEVESALMEHPAVLECAITAVPDDLRGQIVKATIVLTKNYQPSDALVKELQNHVKKVTAPYKYPRIVEFVKELPKTTSGKIRRVEIRENDKK
ncbi:MAG: AMP-binding protein [Clostridiales bacterium]|nr:AMP-binding protein [Clostridiales bacterium]